jgi:hypothetical protein
MADITQSATQSLLAHQEITHPGNVIGTGVDVSSWLAAEISVWLANIETTANATGVAVAIQGSVEASGNDWVDLMRWTGSTTASETEVLTATEPVGETVLAMASTTNLAVGDLVYVKDDTGVAESEWHEIVSVATNTSITIADGLAVEKVANDDVYDQAQRFTLTVDCAGLKRIRAIVVHQAATGSDIRVKASMVGATDIE